jgi:hypothetical protein
MTFKFVCVDFSKVYLELDKNDFGNSLLARWDSI